MSARSALGSDDAFFLCGKRIFCRVRAPFHANEMRSLDLVTPGMACCRCAKHCAKLMPRRQGIFRDGIVCVGLKLFELIYQSYALVSRNVAFVGVSWRR